MRPRKVNPAKFYNLKINLFFSKNYDEGEDHSKIAQRKTFKH